MEITAWDGTRLVGLIRGLDGGEMVAFLHYLLGHPDYQGNGIAIKLLTMAKERYKDYLYINIMPDEKKIFLFTRSKVVPSFNRVQPCRSDIYKFLKAGI